MYLVSLLGARQVHRPGHVEVERDSGLTVVDRLHGPLEVFGVGLLLSCEFGRNGVFDTLEGLATPLTLAHLCCFKLGILHFCFFIE